MPIEDNGKTCIYVYYLVALDALLPLKKAQVSLQKKKERWNNLC